MADVELLIKIPDSKLWSLKHEPIKENFNMYELASYIDKGTPLPKGHGKIGDIDRLQEVFRRNVIGADAYKQLFDDAPTIIEADKENE